jgi:hypothetical protein
MIYLNKLIFIFLLITGTHLFGQSKVNNTQQKKLYQYSFLGQLNSQSISTLENRLATLPFVTLVKVKYKFDSQKGEVFLNTSEKAISSEGEKGFDLIEFKKALIAADLTPLELNTTILD